MFSMLSSATSTPIERLVGDHLWQSTLFTGVVYVLTLVLRKNRAAVRHGLWLAASAKFVIPFEVFVAVGRHLGLRSASAVAGSDIAVLVGTVSQPFSQAVIRDGAVSSAIPSTATVAAFPLLLVATYFCGSTAVLLTWWVRRRRAALIIRRALLVEGGPELTILRRVEAVGGVAKPMTMVSSDASAEPGVFGILKPVLFWPGGITAHLGAPEVEAILAHEVCHVRRRDNLAAIGHVFVQALCWFHPFVWWLGARLLEERELACDQEVIQWGSTPETYAQSILKTCRFCVESPQTVMAGVTGSSLERRVEQIMRNDVGAPLNRLKWLMLTSVGIAAVGGPIVFGVLHAPPLRAQSLSTDGRPLAFEAASLKANKSGSLRVFVRPSAGGRFTVTNMPARGLIRYAYQLQEFQLVGGPSWLGSDRFDVVATAGANATTDEMRLMLRTLLADRLKLTVHREARELPFYALVTARSDRKLGPQLRPTAADCANAPAATGPPYPDGPPPCGFIGPGPGTSVSAGRATTALRGITMDGLAKFLASAVRRSVFDRTGLSGYFDADLDSAAELGPPPPPPGVSDPYDRGSMPSIFTVLREQLGLKLDSQKGPVDVMVIDKAQRPTEDQP